MSIFILILVGLGGVWLGRKLALWRMRSIYSRNIQNEPLTEVNKQRQEQKEEAKQKILDFIRQNGRAKNDDIENLLGVSDATATNYLSELEKEEKIMQSGGEAGRGVFYTIR